MHPRTHGRRASLAACALLVLLPAAANWQPLTGWLDASPLYIVSGLETSARPGPLPGLPGWIDPDAGSHMQALGRLAADQWLHGRVPWWNPFSGIGMPLAAEMQPAALLLPFVLLMHFADGLLFVKVALQVTAGLSTWALLRSLDLRRLAALIGAALFQMNGSFAFLGHAPTYPIAFLPLLLLGLERAGARAASGAPGGQAVIAAGLAASLYAGFPETAYIDGLLALAWAAVLAARMPAGRRLALAGKIAAGGAAGLLLSAPAVWPFLHLLMHGVVDDLGVGHRFAGLAMPPQGAAALLFPFLFGPALALAGQDPTGAVGPVTPYIGGSLSLTALFLALLSLRGGRLRPVRLLLAAWLVLALGRTFGAPALMPAVDAIPLLDRAMVFRYACPTCELAVAALAALAVDDWLRSEGLSRSRRLVACGLAAAAGGAALATVWGSVSAMLRQAPDFPPYLAATLAWAGLFIAALALLTGRRPSGGRAAAAGLIVVAECACVFNLPLFAGVTGARIDDGAVAFLQAHAGLSRFYTLGPFRPNYGAYFGVASINAEYLPVPSDWAAHVRGELDPGTRLVMFRGDEPPSTPGRPSHVDELRARLPAYEALGVRYVLARPGEDPFRRTVTPAAPVGDIASTRSAGDDPRPARVYAGEALDVFELRDPAPYFSVSGGSCALAPAGREKVDADCAAPAALIRRELDYPGWRAKVNGRAAPVTRADPLFQSVALPAGRSHVRFAYAPPQIGLCYAAAAGGLAWLAAPVLWRLAQRRRRTCPGLSGDLPPPRSQ